MTPARHHAEWLSLVETSGPFLSMPVLLRVFQHGLDPRDPAKASRLREAYEDWLERGEKQPAVHHAWIRHVLTELLEYPPEFLVEGQAIPPGTEAVMANYGETIRPDYVLLGRRSSPSPPAGAGGEGRGEVGASGKPILLVEHYAPDQDLEKPVAGKTWKASPGTRMMELLHAADVPLGLVTNGEQWMLVSAPRGETTGFASWYADLWMQDPLYDQHYAVSTLSELLRERADQHGEEVLERRHDAWCRLLATFRAVHAGVEHEAMRLPPYGGTLFDPNRYPFLEGRAADTHWQTTPAKPKPPPPK